MKRRWIRYGFAVIGLAAIVTAVWTRQVYSTQHQLAEKVIRLHVIANSDTEADQALKLQVRDAILPAAEEIMKQAPDMAHAAAALETALPELEKTAEGTLAQNGCTYSVTAALGWENYPTRVYDTFTMPAGRYVSLRLTIGEGSGQNWWCVVFPPLCNAASSEEFSQAAQAAGLTSREIALLTEESGGYTVRLKSMELLARVMEWFA